MRAVILVVLSLFVLVSGTAHAQSWPNEPIGSTLLSDHSYSSLAGDGWSIQGGGVSVVSDGTAPHSPTSVMQHRFGPGLPGGNSVGVSYFPLSPTRRELYMGFWWKASSNWEGGALGGGQKISFIQGAGAWNMVMLLNPNGKISVYFPNTEQVQNCQLQGSWGDCPGTVQVYPNVSNPTIGFGSWHRIEYYVKMSSTSSSQDGVIRWWVDGQLNGNFTNANFPQYQIIQAEFDPTWGNVGDTKTTETFFWYDHVRVSTGGASSGGGGGGGIPKTDSPPSQVTGLQATPSTGSVQLQWNAATDDSGTISSYTVQMATSAGGPFSTLSTPTSTAYNATGLTNGTTYYFRVSATDPAGQIGANSSTVSATPTAIVLGPAPVLSVTSNGRFALNGVPTFLPGISFYDCQNWRTSDVDTLTSKGIKLFVCHLDDTFRVDADSLYNADGSIRAAKATAINNFIAYAGSKGAVVDIITLYADVDGSNSATYLSASGALSAANVNAVNAFKANPNVLFSTCNAHNAGSFCDSEAEASAFLADMRAACASCVISYSSADTFSVNGHIFNPPDSNTISTATVDAELATGLSILTQHLHRGAGWGTQGYSKMAALRQYLDSHGFQNKAIYLQVSGREGSGGLGSADAYLSYVQQVRAAGAAAWVLHTDAGYDMSATAFMANVDAVETGYLNGLTAAMTSSSTLVRDTASYTMLCTGTGADLGATWDAGYTSRTNWQTVTDRCRPTSTSTIAVESYNGTAPQNLYVQADNPTFTKSGSSTTLGLGFQTAPASGNGYFCLFEKSTTDRIRLVRVDANVLTDVATPLTTTLTTGQKGCEKVGDTIRATIAGTSVLSTQEFTYPGALRPSIYGLATGAVGDLEIDNIAVGGFTEQPYVAPQITGATVTGTGATLTWSGSIASVRIMTYNNTSGLVGSTVYPISALPGGVLTRTWVVPEEGFCAFAIDSNGVETSDPAGYQCRPVTPTADTTPPVASGGTPTGTINGSPGNGNSVGVSWITNESSICRVGTSDAAYASLPNLAQATGGSTHSYTLTGLSDGATVTVYTRCQDVTGNTATSSYSWSFTISSGVGDTTKPSTVTNLSANVLSSTQIAYSWTAATDNVAVVAYRIYRCTDVTCASKSIEAVTTTANTTWTLVGLSPGTRYFHTITAVDAAANESVAISNVVEVRTAAAGEEDVIPPSDVTGLIVASSTYNEIVLSYDQGTDIGSGVRSTEIERCVGHDCTGFVPWLSSTSLTARDPLVHPDTWYRYRAKRTDNGGNTSPNYSAIVSINTGGVPEGSQLALWRRRSRVH